MYCLTCVCLVCYVHYLSFSICIYVYVVAASSLEKPKPTNIFIYSISLLAMNQHSSPATKRFITSPGPRHRDRKARQPDSQTHTEDPHPPPVPPLFSNTTQTVPELLMVCLSLSLSHPSALTVIMRTPRARHHPTSILTSVPHPLAVYSAVWHLQTPREGPEVPFLSPSVIVSGLCVWMMKGMRVPEGCRPSGEAGSVSDGT